MSRSSWPIWATVPIVRTWRSPLVSALGDPSVELAYWSADLQEYVAPDGLVVDVPEDDPDRAVTYLASGSDPLGAVIHDAALLAEPQRVQAACAAVRLSLDNDRLQALVRAQLVEVRASRARIVEAAEQGRRDIERDLHDGAQQRLLGVLLDLQLQRDRIATVDPTVAEGLGSAIEELRDAVAEIRELSRGLHPSILDHGLVPAIESLAETSAIPVTVHNDQAGHERRCRPAIEAAAHFVVREAVTNATRYSGADHVEVDISDDGDRLALVIRDHGAGGAAVRAGGGLESLEDRVLALGGSWTVRSPAGSGTTIEVELPCG